MVKTDSLAQIYVEKTKEACRQLVASWHEQCQTDREHQLLNDICGEITVLKVDC